LKHELAQLLLYKIAWLKDQNKPAAIEASIFKLFLSESLVESGVDTLRNFGGPGYLTEYEVERDYRDVAGTIIYAGTSDIQRNVIANLLGL
jgi:alkylation response protein AidB-like acyl-CoA dehydrogenase